MVSGLKVERPGGQMTQGGYKVFCILTGRYTSVLPETFYSIEISILKNVMDLSWLWWCRPLVRHQETGRQISMCLRPAWSAYIAPSQPTTLSQGWGSVEPADLLRLYILEFQFKARSTVPASDFCSVNTAKPFFRVLL